MLYLFRSTRIEHAGEKVDLQPLARDAIRHLGLFKRNQARWLAVFVAAHFNKGSKSIALEMRKDGKPMGAELRKELGLGRALMSAKTWSRFAAGDTNDVVRRMELIVTRICIHAYKAGKRKQLDRTKPGFSVYGDEVLIVTPGDLREPCHAVRPLLNKAMRLKSAPVLPVRGCDVDVCDCNLEPAWLHRR